MDENLTLASLPQRTLDGWHRFVASGDRDLLQSLLSEHIVFRSPFVQSPITGAAGCSAGADDRGADFREFSLSPDVCRRLTRRRAGI
jgi:hypothetical protein